MNLHTYSSIFVHISKKEKKSYIPSQLLRYPL